MFTSVNPSSSITRCLFLVGPEGAASVGPEGAASGGLEEAAGVGPEEAASEGPEGAASGGPEGASAGPEGAERVVLSMLFFSPGLST